MDEQKILVQPRSRLIHMNANDGFLTLKTVASLTCQTPLRELKRCLSRPGAGLLTWNRMMAACTSCRTVVSACDADSMGPAHADVSACNADSMGPVHADMQMSRHVQMSAACADVLACEADSMGRTQGRSHAQWHEQHQWGFARGVVGSYMTTHIDGFMKENPKKGIVCQVESPPLLGDRLRHTSRTLTMIHH